MKLGDIDRQLLAGEFGGASQYAMNLLQRYGDALGAERFIDIESAHIDSCLYHGPSGLDFVHSLVDRGGAVRVPATLNVSLIDLVHPGVSDVSREDADAQREMVDAYRKLGCRPTLTCAPYQGQHRPAPGQHVAWAESNAIVFANSVLGARTDRYGDFTDICAALTGRVPAAGLHRGENRWASLALDVPTPAESGLERDLYFACLGYVLGEHAGNRVAVIDGAPRDASEDELKALGAAAASSGSVAMFHLVGATPEAETLDHATGGKPVETRRVSGAEMATAADGLCRAAIGEPVAALCLGTPHYSREEFRRLAESIDGRRAASGVSVLVSTSRETAAWLESVPWADRLLAFGVRLVVDTCTYLTPPVLDGDGWAVTPSAKWAHYAPGHIGRRGALMSLERCLRCAVAGEIVA